MTSAKIQVSNYDLKKSLTFTFFDSPEELINDYGFRGIGSDGYMCISTAPQVIEVCGELFFGNFIYQEGYFKSLDLTPITNIDDNYQSDRKIAAEKQICDQVVSGLGRRVGPFLIKTIKRQWRDSSSIAEQYRILVMDKR